MNKSSLIKCGFDVYFDIDTGDFFEKQAKTDKLVKVESDKLKAEQRFVLRHLKNKEVGADE